VLASASGMTVTTCGRPLHHSLFIELVVVSNGRWGSSSFCAGAIPKSGRTRQLRLSLVGCWRRIIGWGAQACFLQACLLQVKKAMTTAIDQTLARAVTGRSTASEWAITWRGTTRRQTTQWRPCSSLWSGEELHVSGMCSPWEKQGKTSPPVWHDSVSDPPRGIADTACIPPWWTLTE
jgi:hypothetical protein